MIRTTSALYHVRLRDDLPREIARDYWAGPHAAIVQRLPHLVEYTQHHFSTTDTGYWPATPTVATAIPTGWQLDGIAELRLRNAVSGAVVAAHSRDVFLDEQNVFGQVLGHLACPRGGRWWSTGYDDRVGHRTVLLIRRRSGISSRAFRGFVHDVLGPALHRAGAHDVRAYVFRPLPHLTPAVSHDYPPARRYHATVILGADSRADVDRLIAAPEVSAAITDQHRFCTAIHAYTVERLVPVVRTSEEES